MDALIDEVESLEAILMEDVKIRKNPDTGFPELIETTVFPVVDGDTDQQYICITLQVLPKPGYPDISPDFNLVRPRGLDDYRQNEIKDACVKKLTESIGYPVVFDLIEVIREHLTGSNLPSGQCTVCLYGFQDGDEFTKTECYHYLHSYCLARHLIASKKNYQEEQDKLPPWLKKMSDPFQAVCPVCREPIKDEADSLKNAPPPAELECAPDFQLTDDLKELQMKMSNLFLQQKSRGAIIDLDADEGNVISIEPEDQSHSNQRKGADNPIEGGENENESELPISIASPNAQSNQRQTPVRANQNRYHNRSNNQHQQQQQQQQQLQQTNFTPIVSSSQRYAPEPTNNNYSHHNRRHYRGRRHHHHHHHHYQNSSHSQQDPANQQKSANVQAPCGSSTR